MLYVASSRVFSPVPCLNSIHLLRLIRPPCTRLLTVLDQKMLSGDCNTQAIPDEMAIMARIDGKRSSLSKTLQIPLILVVVRVKMGEGSQEDFAGQLELRLCPSINDAATRSSPTLFENLPQEYPSFLGKDTKSLLMTVPKFVGALGGAQQADLVVDTTQNMFQCQDAT
ncbi:hypothetical protein B0H12DRAFT_1223357 [Mycena haematopus]|nr:hypothetical protein B0H12DRAFT_1223357 [Mycena haematopus]